MRRFPAGNRGNQQATRLFGLVGFPLGHSFSQPYFENKFRQEAICDSSYLNFELPDIGMLPAVIQAHPTLIGLNVTIPYKLSVIRIIDHLDPVAEQVGAVNTIKIKRDSGKVTLTGYNTDVTGFEASLASLIGELKPEALVLGTGGASLAVIHVLEKLLIPYRKVSRQATYTSLSYNQLNEAIIQNHRLIINCTPLGTWPDIGECPPIPYEGIGEGHFLFDLVYNPEITTFLARGSSRGALIRNGWDMLVGQAEAAWRIWNG